MSSRVAITGIGVVSNAGLGTEVFWNSLICGVPEHGFYVKDFDPLPYFDGNAKEARRSDRFAQFALAAAHEATSQAGDFLDDPTAKKVAGIDIAMDQSLSMQNAQHWKQLAQQQQHFAATEHELTLTPLLLDLPKA